ncbi:GNAT family N-acetyltransferase [Xylanimonas protaetiae]|uniref:GNAT family N-acetyltransferase n=1 Tax=Xylanimonas protaetiae TaxID=2509457 RepID=A0A4P6F5U9_9MICO|nr:GNAT family N-acetyltransferase [Xylanimonas protaetiae]QAY70765.1 GNAT family N-acetyltransferase [Xylanimonas protaetiae]
MSNPAPAWRIVEVPAPPVGADWEWEWRWVYQGYSRIRQAVELETWGHHDRWAPTPILMAFLADNPWKRNTLVAAVRDDADGSDHTAVLGVAEIGLPQQDDEHLAFVSVSVHPDHRAQGIGTALADAADTWVARTGRTVAVSWSAHAPEPDPGPGVVTAPTGSGRVDTTDAAARFALRRGFALEQVARASTLPVPDTTSDVEQHLAAAVAAAGDDYVVHTWNRTVPAEFHERLAVLWARMSTDAPHAAVETEAQQWDAARVAAHLEEQAQAHQQVLLTAAEHAPTGALTAFTELALPDFDEVDFGFQGDTLVISDHRGRRLGMLVKATNLLAMMADRPKIRRIHTFNAEENTFMLSINVALGFRGAGVLATWQRHDVPGSDAAAR